MAFLFNYDDGMNSIGWVYSDTNCVLDLVESITDDKKSYGFVCKPRALYNIGKSGYGDKFDKLWFIANNMHL